MNKISSITKILAVFLALFSLAMLNGCKDSVVATNADNVEISIISTPELTAQNGVNAIILDSIKVLIKDIKLNVSGNSDTVNFKTGPFVYSLNPNSTLNTVGSLYIPIGSYDKVQFEIHKLEDADGVPDPIFNFGGGKYSVVVYGRYNGTAFIYRSSKSAKQKLNFNPPALVTTLTKSNITLKVQPYKWFWNGTDYLDPAIPSNENDIDNNIKASFKAFKDDNHDGIGD